MEDKFFVHIPIHTTFFPTQKCKLDDDIIIFPSKEKIEKDPKYLTIQIITYLVICGEKNILTKKYIYEIVNELSTFSNFAVSSPELIKWLQSMKFNDLILEIKPFCDLDSFVENNIESEIHLYATPWSWTNFYEENKLFYVRSRFSESVDFSHYFRIYRKIGKYDKIRKQIDLISFINSIPFLARKVYENIDLEISLTFSVIETLIKEIIDTKKNKVCSNCGIEREGTKGISVLINEYVDSLPLHPEDKKNTKKILSKMKDIRNDFYHGLNYITKNESINNVLDKLGKNSVSIEEDIEFGKARTNGFPIVLELVKYILLGKLDNVK